MPIYFDANFLIHGFVRGSEATIIEFDVPDGVNGTQPSGIDAAGAITGVYYDENFIITVSCALPTAPSRRSILRGPRALRRRHQPRRGHHGSLF